MFQLVDVRFTIISEVLIMFVVPIETMFCDTASADGEVYFYKDYLEWVKRGSGATTIKIFYEAISDVKVIPSFKKQVIIYTKGGKQQSFYLYKANTFVATLHRIMEERENSNVVEAEVKPKDDDLSKLERLAKLHESGALTDEEFAKAKAKILG